MSRNPENSAKRKLIGGSPTPLGTSEKILKQTKLGRESVTGSLDDPCDDWSVAIGQGLLIALAKCFYFY
jgi:hypothetical protein